MSKNNNSSLMGAHYFQSGIVWILIVVGICLYVTAFLVIDNNKNPNLRDFILNLANADLIGIVVGYITSVASFLGVFKKDLQEILYSKEFLNRKKNIGDIWINVSRALFEEKFPSIHDQLFEIIKKYYICGKETSYNQNYRAIIDITWDDKDKKFVKVVDTINYTLIVQADKKIKIPFYTWLKVKGLSTTDYYSKFTCKIDNKEVPKKEIETSIETKDGNFIQKCIVTINGKKGDKFSIEQTREKRYSFDLDYDISFRARYIVNNMSITLNHPEDMGANFICRGTVEDFIKIKESSTSLEYSYNGLLLQRQGYTFALKRA